MKEDLQNSYSTKFWNNPKVSNFKKTLKTNLKTLQTLCKYHTESYGRVKEKIDPLNRESKLYCAQQDFQIYSPRIHHLLENGNLCHKTTI